MKTLEARVSWKEKHFDMQFLETTHALAEIVKIALLKRVPFFVPSSSKLSLHSEWSVNRQVSVHKRRVSPSGTSDGY